jgi:hypothetical protein
MSDIALAGSIEPAQGPRLDHEARQLLLCFFRFLMFLGHLLSRAAGQMPAIYRALRNRSELLRPDRAQRVTPNVRL